MYPGTIFNWHDNSAITVPEVPSEIDDAPLFMQVFSSDKGTEDLIEISGSDFDAMYGTMRFDKHGQSAIQAKNIINAGGRLYAKRVVADDALLANTVLWANVSTVTEVDQETGQEVVKVKVKWEATPVQGKKTIDEIIKSVTTSAPAEGKYPLIVYADNGRGESGKSVRLNPDYSTSKTIGKTFYTLVVYENSNITEQATITFDPTVVYNDTAYRLDKTTNIQITGTVIEDMYELYVQKLAETIENPKGETGDTDYVRNLDIIYGYDNRGNKLTNFIFDETGDDPDVPYGIKLDGGSNGKFGYTPAVYAEYDESDPTPQGIAYKAWSDAIKAVFDGSFSDEVWDVDQHKIAAVVDANYPIDVKDAIFLFVSFRKDCMFFRDYGCGANALNDDLTTYDSILAAYNSFNRSISIQGTDVSYSSVRNYFTTDFATYYQIKDPVTKKNIEVTMCYDLANILVSHIANVPFAPPAGTANGMILSSAIKGTLNFVPVVAPQMNQKDALDKIRVNYAIFEDDNCVVQSCYTSQEPYTQLSYSGNVLGIQRVLRAVRTACPKQRYSLSTANDLQDYATAVNNVLSNYVTNFDVLNFIYQEDRLKISQKIFYASIEFAFLNWAQTEIFDVYAINNQ